MHCDKEHIKSLKFAGKVSAGSHVYELYEDWLELHTEIERLQAKYDELKEINHITVRDGNRELKRLEADIQYALDRLSCEADQGPGLRVLIDEATNHGDYFPSSELKRRLNQIHEINRHFGSFQDFVGEIIEDTKRLFDKVGEQAAEIKGLREERDEKEAENNLHRRAFGVFGMSMEIDKASRSLAGKKLRDIMLSLRDRIEMMLTEDAKAKEESDAD